MSKDVPKIICGISPDLNAGKPPMMLTQEENAG